MRFPLKDILIILFLNLVLVALIWLPFYFRLNYWGYNFSGGLETIYRNFDGLEYIVIAKSFYNPELIAKFPLTLGSNYFAAHFPGYAMLLIPLGIVFGYLKSMILTSLLFTILASLAFYWMVKDLKLTNHPLLLSAVFLVLPARWLIVHSVGSPEPIFIFFTILTFYFFLKFEDSQKTIFIWLTALFGALAQFTRPPGILILIAFFLYLLWRVITKKLYGADLTKILLPYTPLLLILISLVLVFFWYSISYQDFFAYFHSGDNIHLMFPPFQAFNINQSWIGTIWLEDIIYIFILGLFGGMLLFKQNLIPLGFFVVIYMFASLFVAHRDISRYTLPVFPFVLIAFEKILVSKEFKIVLAIVLLGIYFYAQNFLISNTAPVADLKFFN